MIHGIEVWQLALAFVGAITVFVLLFLSAMARFLKRPSPSEAIIRIGRSATDVFIARACWIVPILHRAATLSLATIGLTIRRASHDALVSKDFISMNLSAEFYVRVEPNEDDVKKAARTNVVQKNLGVNKKDREEAQRPAEVEKEKKIMVAKQNRLLREGKAKEEEAAVKAELSKNEAIETRDLQRQANIAVERARKEEMEQASEIGKQKAIEAAQVDKQRVIESAQVDKTIALTMKAKESAEADAKRAEA